MPARSDFVVIRTFTSPIDAHLACSALRAAGIDAELSDDHLIEAQWIYSNAIGGVKVWVPEGDVNAAVEVLDQPATTVDDRPILTCPECGSHDVTPDRTGLRRTMLSWLLLGVPIFRVRRGQLRCDRCGHIFATPDGPNAA